MATPTTLTPRRPPPEYGDPRRIHHPTGLCRGCGAGSAHDHLLYLDVTGLNWHADCYVTILQTAPPRAWRLGRRVLPFTR